ncbi:hypothetical protein F5Y19DRAFT_491598 [Xylariaceae sp. FL1651]|nr:hypothetical protein F5Y19DRAFT_491598 [Xylariaceae sp. FL1651]
MADIYGNAQRTLCATASADDYGGLYGQALQDIQPQKVLVHGRDGTWKDTRDIYFPLLTRGWVLQERLLSPRLPHFAWCELLCEWFELCACGCLPAGGLRKYQPNIATKVIDKLLFKKSTLLSDLCWYPYTIPNGVLNVVRPGLGHLLMAVLPFKDIILAESITSVLDAQMTTPSPNLTDEVTLGYIIFYAATCVGRIKIKGDYQGDGIVFWGPDYEFNLDSPDFLQDAILFDGDEIVWIRCHEAPDADYIPTYERVSNIGKGLSFMRTKSF